ncbi:Spy/CpxP family protein refolding chaperone [Thermodesulfobacteriota bacterium]
MKRRNKYLIGGCIAFLVVLLTGFGFMSAWGTPDESDRGFGPRKHGRGFHRGFSNKNVTEFIMWRMEKKIEDLDFSEKQMAEFKTIQTTLEIRINEFIDHRKVMMDEFYAEINKDEPDLKDLKESMKVKITEMSEFMGETLDLFLGFYETLNKEQKAKVLRDIRNRFEEHGK